MLKTRIDYFLLSPGWKPTSCTIASSDASDHRPIELTVGSAATTTSSPTTAP
jgi:endonuclease/exonuclease/phosphatase (EEP) superfamily protein YafD